MTFTAEQLNEKDTYQLGGDNVEEKHDEADLNESPKDDKILVTKFDENTDSHILTNVADDEDSSGFADVEDDDSDCDDEFEQDINRKADNFPVRYTSTPTKGDQLVPSSVDIATPRSTYSYKTSFSKRQLYHLEMLFRESQYPNSQQISDLAETEGIENEKSVKMWFQNRRSRFRKLPRLSPVKPAGDLKERSLQQDGTSSSVAARMFSPIVIQPKSSSAESSTKSNQSPLPTPKPVAHHPLNVSSSSTESTEENTKPPVKTVVNTDEYKSMTMTTLPPDHPFCKLTHGSGSRIKRKVVRDSDTDSQLQPPNKIARKDDGSPHGQRTAAISAAASGVTRRRFSHQQHPTETGFGTDYLNQLSIGLIPPGWPSTLPISSGILSQHKNQMTTTSHIIDLSGRRPSKHSKDLKNDPKPHIPTASLPMIPPYFSFPMMSGQFNPFMPTGVGAPFMVPMFGGAYTNPAAFWAQQALNNPQKSS